MDKLTIEFTKPADVDAMKAATLAFLKVSAVAPGQTVRCTVRGSGKGGGQGNRTFAANDAVEALAGKIAEFLAEYANGKDGYCYDDATIEVRRP